MKICFISPFWLPLHGGGEQYEHRLAVHLKRSGHDVHVFTGTQAKDHFDNGSIDATRHFKWGEFQYASWLNVWSRQGNPSNLFIQYEFMESAVDWIREIKPDVVIVGNALNNLGAPQARELFMSIKALNIPIGLIHHDLSRFIESMLIEQYHKSGFDWDTAQYNVKQGLSNFAEQKNPIGALAILESPLFFRPDFVISNSDWSEKFIDPYNSTHKFVMHPILDFDTLGVKSYEDTTMKPVDVLMINPQERKNPAAMSDLICDNETLNFRVLKGGWGDSFKTFIPAISNHNAYKNGRVDLVEYTKNISDAYCSTKVMFFPSLIEGYGMAAVEPMRYGTPVVCSNYPPILEAVGNSAFSLCPYKSSRADWSHAVLECLNNYDYWVVKSIERAQFLKKRQATEIKELENFLRQFVNADNCSCMQSVGVMPN